MNTMIAIRYGGCSLTAEVNCDEGAGEAPASGITMHLAGLPQLSATVTNDASGRPSDMKFSLKSHEARITLARLFQRIGHKLEDIGEPDVVRKAIESAGSPERLER